MFVYKNEQRTPGAILAELLQQEAAGKNTAKLEQEFKEKSIAALGDCCADFTITRGEVTK